jgi:hypothetical protein
VTTGIVSRLFTFPQIRLNVGYTEPGDAEYPGGLPYRDYYFRLEETDIHGAKMISGNGWTYDQTSYVLTVRVWELSDFHRSCADR